LYKTEKKKDISIMFIALADEDIIGYLVIEEKIITSPLHGINWWIWSIRIQPELRWQGIASALLEETIKHAEQANVIHLQGSVNPTLKANMFWFKNNFCFFRYGGKIEDTNNSEEYGNYPHMMFRRINRTENKQEHIDFCIMKADKEQTDSIFDEYILNINPDYFKDKRDDIFALTALDKIKISQDL
jgi:GNAT superfamily N-acetyltransferase